MSVKTRLKTCTNCNKKYDGAKSLPLCPQCLSRLDGYERFVLETKNNADYTPCRATKEVLAITRFEIF